MKEFLKNLMLNLNEDESDSDTNANNINKNYDLINLFKQSSNKKQNFNYDYEYKLDNEVDAFLVNENKLTPQGHVHFEQRLMDESLEQNPFLIDKKKYGNSLKKLFINSETETSYNDFNTETRIDLLGGLTLWQFTAIIFAALICIGKN